MNLCPMPDGNTAALNIYMSEQDAAEVRHEELLAEHPLEDFHDDAWAAAMENHELLHYLVDEVPMTVLSLILHHTNSAPDWLSTNTDASEHMLIRLIAIWIEDQQERMQANAIEAAR